MSVINFQKNKKDADIALNIKDVRVGYGSASVIQDVSFDVRAGETFGLIGLNGAGKTTLIKSILGLLEYQGGDISVFGFPPGHVESKRHLSYLPERFEPAWFLSGIEF